MSCICYSIVKTYENRLEGKVAIVIGGGTDRGEAIVFTCNIFLETYAKSFEKLAVSKFGQLNILVNSAGVFPEMNLSQGYDKEALSYMIKNNIKFVFAMSKAALPELHKTKENIVGPGSIDLAWTHTSYL